MEDAAVILQINETRTATPWLQPVDFEAAPHPAPTVRRVSRAPDAHILRACSTVLLTIIELERPWRTPPTCWPGACTFWWLPWARGEGLRQLSRVWNHHWRDRVGGYQRSRGNTPTAPADHPPPMTSFEGGGSRRQPIPASTS